MSTYILWDIDGTLIYNNPQGGGLYVESIRLATGAAPTERVPNPHGMTEGQLLTAILEVNGHDTALVGDVLVHLDRLSLDQHEAGSNPREACKGTADAIERVRVARLDQRPAHRQRTQPLAVQAARRRLRPRSVRLGALLLRPRACPPAIT